MTSLIPVTAIELPSNERGSLTGESFATARTEDFRRETGAFEKPHRSRVVRFGEAVGGRGTDADRQGCRLAQRAPARCDDEGEGGKEAPARKSQDAHVEAASARAESLPGGLRMDRTLTTAVPLRSVNYGTRLKLGMMFPSANSVAEPQMNAMLPAGVALLTTRLHLDPANRLSMLDRTEEATSLLVDAGVDLLAFHCTGVTMTNRDVAAGVKARIAACTSTPVVVTSDAIVAALSALNARSIVLVSPYVQEVNDYEKAFLAQDGVTVVADRALELRGAVAYGSVEPRAWYDHTVAMRRPDADAYFLSCTAIKSVDAVDALERELGRPVITSNQAMLWFALRSAGITDRIDGFGRLLSAH